jgi:ABC-type bacteriocin/lantibiotic exporter with double-glycine peptidase domain
VGEALIRYTDVEIHQQELCVLNDVNLELHKGEFVYLVGKVGSGKTSLLKTFYGELDIASVAETAIMDVYPYAADESITDTISENANSPVVRNFIQSLPEGCRTTITVGGKKVVVDKTGKDTIVTPEKQSDNDT